MDNQKVNSLTSDKDITNQELIQKIKKHILVDEKEMMKLKKETLLMISNYCETTQYLLEKKTTNTEKELLVTDTTSCSNIPAHLSINIDLITKTSVINLTGNEKGEKVSKIIESVTEDQIKILSKHVHKKLARGTEIYFDFITTIDDISFENFIKSLEKDKEVKTYDKDLVVLMNG